MTRATGGLTLSVIVPVFNGEATLGRCLAALRCSETTIDELIVADDGSTDATPALARQAGARVISVQGGPSGPGRARNLAATHATGDVLVFIDADVEVTAKTLERLTAPLRTEPALTGTFGSYDDAPACTDPVSLYANLRHHWVHQRSAGPVATFWAGCGAMRREAFLALGGFDELRFRRPSIEDVELGLRLSAQSGRIRLLPDAQAKHLKHWRLWTLWRTDILQRAIPWGRLVGAPGSLSPTLNANRGQRLAALLALVSLAGFAGLAFSSWVSPIARLVAALTAAGALLGWAWLNGGLLRLLAKRGGLAALAGGSVLHFAYTLYAPAGLLAGLAWQRWRSARLATCRPADDLAAPGVQHQGKM